MWYTTWIGSRPDDLGRMRDGVLSGNPGAKMVRVRLPMKRRLDGSAVEMIRQLKSKPRLRIFGDDE